MPWAKSLRNLEAKGNANFNFELGLVAHVRNLQLFRRLKQEEGKGSLNNLSRPCLKIQR